MEWQRLPKVGFRRIAIFDLINWAAILLPAVVRLATAGSAGGRSANRLPKRIEVSPARIHLSQQISIDFDYRSPTLQVTLRRNVGTIILDGVTFSAAAYETIGLFRPTGMRVFGVAPGTLLYLLATCRSGRPRVAMVFTSASHTPRRLADQGDGKCSMHRQTRAEDFPVPGMTVEESWVPVPSNGEGAGGELVKRLPSFGRRFSSFMPLFDEPFCPGFACPQGDWHRVAMLLGSPGEICIGVCAFGSETTQPFVAETHVFCIPTGGWSWIDAPSLGFHAYPPCQTDADCPFAGQQHCFERQCRFEAPRARPTTP